MALVRNITKKIEIPGEPDAWAVIRRLSWKQLQVASDARSDAAIGKMKQMGGEVYRAINEVAGGKSTDAGTKSVEQVAQDDTTKKQKDVRAAYDTGTVLRFGVANLSYVETFKTDDVDDLDLKDAEFIAGEILAFSGVGADEKAEEKNG